MILSEEEVKTALTAFMPAAEASRRAAWIIDDMRSVGFELRLSTENPAGLWERIGAIPQVEYIVPSEFDINSSKDEKAMSGSFLTCGNLLRLSQCVKLGRDLLPTMWPGEFARSLLGIEHLDTLNEVWWLKFWRFVRSVERGPKSALSDPDFDWQLGLHDGMSSLRVNLEVKRRTGNINSNFKRGRPHVSVDGIAHKFGPVPANTANVAAMTAYIPLAEDVWRGVITWFDKQPHVHGLLIWIEGNLGSTPLLKLFKPEKRWVEFLLLDIESEDLKVASRTAGTLCKASEAPAFTSKLAESFSSPTIYRP